MPLWELRPGPGVGVHTWTVQNESRTRGAPSTWIYELIHIYIYANPPSGTQVFVLLKWAEGWGLPQT